MYRMSYYTSQDKPELLTFMREFPFAMVSGMGDKYPVASQLPLELVEQEGKLFLTGHLMRKTDHHLAFEKNPHVLVIFYSPHAYINAGWYENKAQASTVNYIAVHAKGIITFTDEAGTLEAIKQLTDKHIGTGSPASFQNIPKDYVDNMLKAIVGFSIEVESLESVFKLSQNRHSKDQEEIIEQLVARNEPGSTFIAGKMKEGL